MAEHQYRSLFLIDYGKCFNCDLCTSMWPEYFAYEDTGRHSSRPLVVPIPVHENEQAQDLDTILGACPVDAILCNEQHPAAQRHRRSTPSWSGLLYD